MTEPEIDISLNDITPNKLNPNRMSKAAFERLKLSITQFGLYYPILVRKTEIEGKYEIVDGEWRWKAFKDLGKWKIPCKIVKVSDKNMSKVAFATSIKGILNTSKAAPLIAKLLGSETTKTLEACNLSTKKIQKKVTFLHLQDTSALGKKEGLFPELLEIQGAYKRGDWKFLGERAESFDGEISNFPVVFPLVVSEQDYDYLIDVVNKHGKNRNKPFGQILVKLVKRGLGDQ
jgi:ParB/RepB/Spo0J family partition protein